MKAKMRYVAVIVILAMGAACCAAQEFSADVVYLTGIPTASPGPGSTSSHNPSKLYVSKDKMRLETGGSDGAVLVVNGEKEGTFALLPATKEYQPLDRGLSEYFRVLDAESACFDWEKTSAQQVNCEKVGDEVVNGRHTVKYRNTNASDVAISSVWIDLATKFVVKWEAAGEVVELRNIKEFQQPADLFELPQDYEMTRPRKGTSKGFSSR